MMRNQSDPTDPDLLRLCQQILKSDDLFDEELKTLAELSLMVYRGHSLPGKYDLREFSIASYDVHIGIYQHHLNPHIKILSIGGTKYFSHLYINYKLFARINDYVSSLTSKSVLSHVFTDIIHLCKDSKISAVVGHSMGGYLAELISSFIGLPGVNFQGPGMVHHYYGKSISPSFRVILAETDYLGNMYYHTHLGQITRVKGLHSHKIVKMIQILPEDLTLQCHPSLITTHVMTSQLLFRYTFTLNFFLLLIGFLCYLTTRYYY